MKAVDVFRKMKEILSTPDKWTKEYSFRDKCGKPLCCGGVPSIDEVGSCCLIGAKSLALYEKFREFEDSASQELSDLTYQVDSIMWKHVPPPGIGRIAFFNDSPETSFQDVQQLLDICIEDSK